MSDIKRMSVKEFREFGFLQELNRQFLHPLGLALEVVVGEETGEERFGEVWDFRDDPEGLAFAEDVTSGKEYKEKASRVLKCWMEKRAVREEKLGFVIQPVPDEV